MIRLVKSPPSISWKMLYYYLAHFLQFNLCKLTSRASVRPSSPLAPAFQVPFLWHPLWNRPDGLTLNAFWNQFWKSWLKHSDSHNLPVILVLILFLSFRYAARYAVLPMALMLNPVQRRIDVLRLIPARYRLWYSLIPIIFGDGMLVFISHIPWWFG